MYNAVSEPERTAVTFTHSMLGRVHKSILIANLDGTLLLVVEYLRIPFEGFEVVVDNDSLD